MTVLSIESLALDIPDERGDRRVLLRDVSLALRSGEALGLVGESGSGKSLTARAVMGLLPTGAHTSGSIVVQGTDVLAASPSDLRALRSNDVAMIFQNPSAHLNPVRTIGDYMTEVLRFTRSRDKDAARRRAVALLRDVRLEHPERVLDMYPHQLSGGMLQRVMIAGALAGEPRLLLADEPTTALDVTIQAEVMAILTELRQARGVALLLITHDLELAAVTCDRTAVMYAGTVVETRTSHELLEHPRHPYSAALTRSRPRLTERVPRLPVVGGRPIAAFEASAGCVFAGRCQYGIPACAEERPSATVIADGTVACLRQEELGDLGEARSTS